jgi:hypothetical protein
MTDEYREITLYAVGEDDDSTRLGSYAAVGLDDLEMQRRVLDLYWDSRLDSASCRAAFRFSECTIDSEAQPLW